MHANFGSCLDHLSDEICKMNTRIDCIACCQSRLGGFAPSPSPEHAEESASSDDGDDDDDASDFESNDEMTTS